MLAAEVIYARLQEIFRDVFDDSIVLAPGLSAKDVEGWDSVTNVQLMLSIERKFNVRFSASQIASFNNVGDLVELLQRRAT